MIKLTALQQSLLAQSVVRSFYTIKIEAPSTTLKMSTFYREFTLSTGDTYTPNCPLVEVQPPQISSSVDREQFSISLADPAFESGLLAEAGLIGSKIEIRIVFLDISNDLPYSDINESLIVYKGQIDAVSYKIDNAEIGSVLYTISCASPMAKLDMAKPYYTSKTFIRENVLSTDSSFDQIYQGSGSVRLKWGKL